MRSEYSAYIGVGSVVPTMIAANAYASSGNPRLARRPVAAVGELVRTVNHIGGARPPHGNGTGQRATAFSAPTPVSPRTSISALSTGSPRSPDVSVPTMPRMKASGMDTIPGLASGNHAKSTPGIIDVFAPDTAGENTISTRVEIKPPYML